MSQLNIGDPAFARSTEDKVDWLVSAMFKVAKWAKDNDISVLADAFSYSGTLTELRALPADTGTADDVRNVLATLLSDLRERGSKGVS